MKGEGGTEEEKKKKGNSGNGDWKIYTLKQQQNRNSLVTMSQTQIWDSQHLQQKADKYLNPVLQTSMDLCAC